MSYSSIDVQDSLLLASSTIASYDSIGTSRTDDLEEVFGGAEGRKRLEKQLLRKLDRRIAFLVLVSIMNYLDRSSAAAARLSGLENDLRMTGRQFNTLISILYVGYVLMQIPSNIFLSSMQRPSIYLSFCVFLWGVCCIATGISQTFAGALTSRFFLGCCEAAWHPGAMFLLSKWYKRSELAWRVAIITSGSTISYAFGALIASGVMEMMDQVFAFAGWRWLFLLEGSATMIIGVFAIFIIPDYPSSPASWLSTEELALARRRVEEDMYGSEDLDQGKYFSGLTQALSDWRVWWLSTALLCFYAADSFTNFFPTLSATMGYSPTISLLLCAPPWIFATITAFVVSSHSDLSGERFWHMSIPVVISITGFVLAMTTMNTVVRYLSLFLMTQITISIDLFMAWVSNSFPHSSSKRAVALALINSVAMTGNIGASYFWPSSWGPSYFRSYLLCILAAVIALVILQRYRSHLEEANRAAEKEERLKGLPKGFRYLL
ncbi:MFS general substrate transporter [Gyrodon lividus]|nr:MFS general substrate transporter [Gyrodon lividus]